jgi:methylated-DNA-[protein]-cysteine S-methyltransferase
VTARSTNVDTAVGDLTLVADDDTLTGLYFPHHWYKPADSAMGPKVDARADPLFAATTDQLDEYLAGARRAFDLPIAARGDTFQHQVWALLADIPYGTTTTYGELAARLGDATLAQDVGRAVGRNPLSIVVPCHRVVGKDGKLTGYAGGLDRKRFLLNLEAPVLAQAATLF